VDGGPQAHLYELFMEMVWITSKKGNCHEIVTDFVKVLLTSRAALDNVAENSRK